MYKPVARKSQTIQNPVTEQNRMTNEYIDQLQANY